MLIHTPITIATTHQIHTVTYNNQSRLKKRVRSLDEYYYYMTPFRMYICPVNDLKTQINENILVSKLIN